MSWQLPQLSPGEVDEIVDQRKSRGRAVFASVLNPQNCEVLGEAGAEVVVERQVEMKELAEKYAAGLAQEPRAKAPASVKPAQPGAPKAGPIGDSTASSSRAPSDWRSLPTLPAQAWTQIQAKEWLPKKAGTTIAIHKGTAWMIKYPRDEFPRSHTVSFSPGDIEGSTSARRECLVWAWRCHREKDGAECPYNSGCII